MVVYNVKVIFNLMLSVDRNWGYFFLLCFVVGLVNLCYKLDCNIRVNYGFIIWFFVFKIFYIYVINIL